MIIIDRKIHNILPKRKKTRENLSINNKRNKKVTEVKRPRVTAEKHISIGNKINMETISSIKDSQIMIKMEVKEVEKARK